SRRQVRTISSPLGVNLSDDTGSRETCITSDRAPRRSEQWHVDTEVVNDPKLERHTRRQFSAAEKRRLLSEYDNLPRGEKGAWLRREGLYGAQLANWRKTLKEQGEQGLEPNSGGRKPKDPRERRIEDLERENARLQKRLHSAEECLSLQKSC
ncbi:hypothetical protein LRD17_09345, partial [Halorhodospira halochloris]|nr:hypothetical protein [Halorhodospira halochloris]